MLLMATSPLRQSMRSGGSICARSARRSWPWQGTQAVSDRAVRHHRGKSADAGQLVVSCLSLGGAVDDGAQVSLLRMEAPE